MGSTRVWKRGSLGKWKVFIIHNFALGAEPPTFGNEKCSCVMCFSKYVPGGPEGSTESKEASDMMGKDTWVWWDGGGSTGNTDAGWVVAGGPIHPSILISAFAWPDPFGNSREARDHYKIVSKGWPMLIIYGWCSRNTLLKWQYIVYYISILLIKPCDLQCFLSLSPKKVKCMSTSR